MVSANACKPRAVFVFSRGVARRDASVCRPDALYVVGARLYGLEPAFLSKRVCGISMPGRTKLLTLKKRASFLAVRGGDRWACPAFALETKPGPVTPNPNQNSNSPLPAPCTLPEGRSPPRFGFTVTKALGNAVCRNRIRRRLKAAVTVAAVPLAKSGHDYVIIARAAAATVPYLELCRLLTTAITRVHNDKQRSTARPAKASPPHRQQKALP
jgi:ribonuclease P protein component